MINDQSVLAIIPARGGSKGLPGKNIKILAGKPLLAWTIEAANKSKYIDRVILSSDDPTIIETAKQYGGDVPFVRPAELASDDSATIDTVLHALDHIPGHDIIVLLQPTCPLRDHNDIDKCIELLIQTNAESCVSVTEPDKNPYWMYTTTEDGRIRPLIDANLATKQRQQLPKVHVLNGAIYAIKAKILEKSGNFVTTNTMPYVMNKEHSIDIDFEIDFELAELLISKRTLTKA